MTGRIEKKSNKNGSTSYRVVIELGECRITGKRLRKFATASTKKEADRLKNQMIADLQGNTFISISNKTVGEWVQEWLDTYSPSYSPTTVRGYTTLVRSHIIPAFGHVNLQNLTALDLQRYYNSLAEHSHVSNKKISTKTIRNINMCLMAALSKAEQLGFVKKNVAKMVELPKMKKYVATVFDRQEVNALLTVSKGSDMEIPIAILLSLELRRGELLALRFSDINFDTNRIHITKSIHRIKGSLVEKPPKTESGNRIINAPPSLMEILKKAKDDYDKAKLEKGENFKDDGYVVHQKDGKPHNPDRFSHKFKQFLAKNGFKEIRLHDMRHTNASLMLLLGLNPKVAQQRLGHSSFNITMDTYSHILAEVEEEATSKLEASLFQTNAVNTDTVNTDENPNT